MTSLQATLQNWQSAPHSRWAFHHVDKLMPSATIGNDPDRIAPLPVAAKRLGMSIGREAFLKATATDAIVVLRDGEVVFESYRRGNDARTPHILMSASKAVIGLLAGVLQHEGAVDLEAPVQRYVPEVEGTVYHSATLRHLLDMRSGAVFDAARQRAYDAATHWVPTGPGEDGANLKTFFAEARGADGQHGGPFRYVSANTDLFGWALERATGESVATLLSTRLWQPMGAERPARITLDRAGQARATARDLARLGQLLVDDGRRGDVQIVPAALIDELLTGGDPEAWRTGQWAAAFAPIAKDIRYRNGWYSVADEPSVLFAMGIHGQNLFVDRKRRLVMAKLSSWKQPIDNLSLWLTHKAFARLQRSVEPS
jgi:CubicO group peptidase (beta-lactamase class C family)